LTDGPLCRLLLAGAAFRVLGDLVDVVLADDETRERVFRGAAELGYRPDTAAQVLRRTRSRHLGVLFSLQQPYEVDLAEAIYPAAERPRLPRRPRSDDRRPRRTPSRGGAAELPKRGHRRCPGGRRARRPTGRRSPRRPRPPRHRPRRRHLQDHIRILPGDYTEESGAQAAGTLLQADKPPSAIFAANDRCAHGVIATLSGAGLDIPNDVSVVGYDDSRIARLSFVDLTTIRQDATQMAELAVEAAAQRLDEGRTTARDIVVKPTLIVRGSTGPARP
jgi:DNA-binding LacI/PurR family transcriptional regulator